jgi:hypothetical protein
MLAFVGCYINDGLEEITRVATASEQERDPLSWRRAECLIEQGLGGVVADGIVLRCIDSVLILVHVLVGIQSSTYKVGLYRGRLTTISCLAFMRSSTCLAALRYDCTPFDSVSTSADEEEAVSTTAPASSYKPAK